MTLSIAPGSDRAQTSLAKNAGEAQPHAKDIYQFQQVPDALRPYIQQISLANCEHEVDFVSPVKPTGAIFLGWVFRGAIDATINAQNVMGHAERWMHIGGQLRDEQVFMRYRGCIGHLAFHFGPIGAYQLLGIPGMASTGKALVAEQLPPWVQSLEQELCELSRGMPEQDSLHRWVEYQQLVSDALQQRIPVQLPVPDYVVNAERLIDEENGACRIADIADQVDVSVRQLNREFTRIVGLSPKFYCRVLQINRALQAMLADNQHYLSEMAQRANFSDQAHFCRVFRQFLGDSPGAFLTGDETMLFHFLGNRGADT